MVVLLGVKVESVVLRDFAVVADGPARGLLLFPEICTMELQLLATGSPDLEVLSHVFHSLLGAVHANRRNAALLYDQVRPPFHQGTDMYIFSQHFFSTSTVR